MFLGMVLQRGYGEGKLSSITYFPGARFIIAGLLARPDSYYKVRPEACVALPYGLPAKATVRFRPVRSVLGGALKKMKGSKENATQFDKMARPITRFRTKNEQ